MKHRKSKLKFALAVLAVPASAVSLPAHNNVGLGGGR